MRQLSYVVIVLLLIIGIATTPWLSGFLFKRDYLQFLRVIANENKINIKVLEYQQGWLKSYVKISVEPRVEPSSPLEISMPLNLTIEQTVSHGPFVYDQYQRHWTISEGAVQSRVHLASTIESFLFRNIANQGILQIYTLANFRNGMLNYFSIPPIIMEVPRVGKLNWQGLQGTIFVNFNNQHITRVKSEIKSGAFSAANNNQASLVIPTILSAEDIYRQSPGLWNGTYNISLPQLSLSDPTLSINLADFNLLAAFGMANSDFYNTSLEIALGSLQTTNFTIQPAKLKISANNLNAKELVNLGYTSVEIDNYYNILPRLFTPNTFLQGDLSLITSAGNLQVNAQALWPKDKTAPTQMDDIVNGINFQLNLRVSISLVDQLMNLAAKNAADNYAAQLTRAGVQQIKEETLEQFVNRLSDGDKISLDVAIRLNELQKRNLPADSYASNIDEYVVRQEITPEIAALLKEKYIASLTAKTNPPPKKSTNGPLSVADFQQKTKQEMQNQINDLIKNGFLVQDKTDYVVTLTREQGVIKANGKDVNLPASQTLNVSPH